MKKLLEKLTLWFCNIPFENVEYTNKGNQGEVTVCIAGTSKVRLYLSMICSVWGSKFWFDGDAVKEEGKEVSTKFPNTLVWRRVPTVEPILEWPGIYKARARLRVY